MRTAPFVLRCRYRGLTAVCRRSKQLAREGGLLSSLYKAADRNKTKYLAWQKETRAGTGGEWRSGEVRAAASAARASATAASTWRAQQRVKTRLVLLVQAPQRLVHGERNSELRRG
jgi:hypothetical protein